MNRGLATVLIASCLCCVVLAPAEAQAAPPGAQPLVTLSCSREQLAVQWSTTRPRIAADTFEIAVRSRTGRAMYGSWRDATTRRGPRTAGIVVRPRSEHQVRVRARTSHGRGPWSILRTLTVGRAGCHPGPP